MTIKTSDIPEGLDTDPYADADLIYAKPAEPVESIDPSQTADPFLRQLQIDLRRDAGLPDYPVQRRSAAD